MASIFDKIPFQGEQSGWKDTSVWLFGQALLGITDVRVSDDTDRQHVYGAGNKPLYRGTGNKSYSGSITVLRSEIVGLITRARASGYGSLSEIPPFAITRVIHGAGGVPIQTQTIKNAQFTNVQDGIAQGDLMENVQLPFIASDVVVE